MENLGRVFTILIVFSLVAGCSGINSTATRPPTVTSQPTDTPTATPIDLPENAVVFTAVARHAASRNETASARVTVHFGNNSDKARTFLFGKGIPPAVCEMGAEDASIVIQAQFTCPLEHEHDCFHAETITLEPGQEYDRELDISVPEEFFSHAEGHQVRATYVTRHSRTAGESVTLIGTIAFYRRWHGISAQEGYSVHHSFPTPGDHPAGIAFDGEHFWIVDSLEKKDLQARSRLGPSA